MAEKTSFSGLRISHPGSYQEKQIITCFNPEFDREITMTNEADKLVFFEKP